MVTLVAEGFREVNWQCRHCWRLLGNVVSEDPPDSFSRGKIVTTPVLFNLIDGSITDVVFALWANLELCSIGTCDNSVVSRRVHESMVEITFMNIFEEVLKQLTASSYFHVYVTAKLSDEREAVRNNERVPFFPSIQHSV